MNYSTKGLFSYMGQRDDMLPKKKSQEQLERTVENITPLETVAIE